jgi:dihydrofolate reductase
MSDFPGGNNIPGWTGRLPSADAPYPKPAKKKNMIRMIAAVSFNGVIGLENKLPFDYPADLKHFRASTLNSTIIMGRKTFEGIGRALPKRRNIVITSRPLDAPGVETFSSIGDAIFEANGISAAKPAHELQDIWLIGGASIYQAGMVYAEEIHLTLTYDVIEGPNPVRFPWINPLDFHTPMYIELKDLVPGDPTLKLAIYKRVESMTY